MSKPDCYKCRHRGQVQFSAHSRCHNPRGFAVKVEANYHGIAKGWFDWPYNFDPVWLDSCDGFEAKSDDVKHPDKRTGAQIVDLFDALKRSLEK